MHGSANVNIMIKAARKAGRSLVKDFREVENLQTSMKSAGDFVSRADIAAEKILKEELMTCVLVLKMQVLILMGLKMKEI